MTSARRHGAEIHIIVMPPGIAHNCTLRPDQIQQLPPSLVSFRLVNLIPFDAEVL
jgi:hypothetical protein